MVVLTLTVPDMGKNKGEIMIKEVGKEEEAAAILLKKDGSIVLTIPEGKGAASNGVMIFATITAILKADPKDEPAFYAIINNRMSHYFGGHRTGDKNE